MIISHQHEFVFIKTRKTAGSSMEIALSKFLGSHDVITPSMPIEEEAMRTALGFRGPQNFGLPIGEWKPNHFIDFAMGRRPKRFSAHSDAKKVAAYLDREEFRRYTKILTVRNPYTYVVSLYNWHARLTGPNPEGFRDWLSAGQGDLRFSNYGMGKVEGRFVMDYVMHFETIAEDAGRLAQNLNLPGDLATVFKSINAKSELPIHRLTFEEAYGFFPRAKELVEEKFHEEISIFGYGFPE